MAIFYEAKFISYLIPHLGLYQGSPSHRIALCGQQVQDSNLHVKQVYLNGHKPISKPSRLEDPLCCVVILPEVR